MAFSLRRWLVLIALSAMLGGLLLWLKAPAALLLGPLLASMVMAASGVQLRLPLGPFVLAQGIVGCMIARMVPLSIVGDIVQHWALFATGVMSVVIVSSLLGWAMTHMRMLPGTTALWGTSPGAASVMTIMAEFYGGDMRLVAFMQYLRVLLVAAVAAVVARRFGIAASHHPDTIVWFARIEWLPLAETIALAVAGPLVARTLRIPAGAMLVPLVVGSVLAHFGWMRIELPTWLLAASYAFIGWNIGLRFTRPLLIHAALALPSIVGGVVAIIALCGGIAAMLVVVAGVDPLTAYLATSPGGADSVAIIASSSNADISFVMAMQTVRLLAVLFMAPALTKFIAVRVRKSYDS